MYFIYYLFIRLFVCLIVWICFINYKIAYTSYPFVVTFNFVEATEIQVSVITFDITAITSCFLTTLYTLSFFSSLSVHLFTCPSFQSY